MSQVKVGMVMVSDGKSRPQPMRLQLTGNMLVLQKEEIVTTTVSNTDTPLDSRERVVKVVRQKVGGLGLSIKGGAEHKLPILISRIFKDQAADQTGSLFVGDAIIKVNDVNIENVNHDEAVNVLRSAGDEVILTVRHYRAATPFLSKSIQRLKDKPSSGEDPTLKLKEEDGWRGGPQQRVERKWVDVMTIHLLMAYLTRYMLDTDKLRPNAFEIRAQDGKPSAVIHCDDAGMLSEWTKHISNNIIQLTAQQLKMLNKSLSQSEQLLHMGWVSEGTSAPQPWYKWRPRFLAIKSTELYLFESPPKNIESELVDDRQHCFLIQSGTSDARYMCAETRAELLRIESAWHQATYNAVTRLGSKTFSVVYEGKTGGLTLDWNMGFALYDTEAKSYLWKYRFSQLKGSSDDSKSKMVLSFQDLDTKEIETRELECANLQSLLYCMHAFLTAKVASVDPAFLYSSYS